MGVFEDNIEKMRVGFPELYQRFNRITPDMIPSETLVGHVSETEADEWLTDQPDPISKNILIFGLANTILTGSIIAACKDESKILIYEPSLMNFIYALGEFDLSFCFQKGVRLLVDGLNDDLFLGVMEEMLDFRSYRDYQVYALPGVSEAFPEQRKRLIEHFAAEGIGWMEGRRQTERYRLHESVENLVNNVALFGKGISGKSLDGVIPKDVPVILVGAGPSLKEDIDTLKKVKDRAFIVVADTALKYALEQGLTPDAFVSIEPKRPITDFEDDRVMDIPMFCRINTMKWLMDKHRAKKIFMHEEDAFVREIYRRYSIPEPLYRGGVNQLTQLFSLFDELCMETVILVGQDMCYGESGESYIMKRESPNDDREKKTVKNNLGQDVTTRLDWYDMIRWYDNALVEIDIKRVINASGKGAKLQGTTYMPLTDAIDKYGKDHQNFGSILDSVRTIENISKGFDAEEIRKTLKTELAEFKNDSAKYEKDRTGSLLGGLLYKYEIADEKGDIPESVKSGLSEIDKLLG